MPYAVYVSTQNTTLNATSASFDLFVNTGPFVGAAMVSVMTTDTWVPDGTDGRVSILPSPILRLPLSSNLHSMNQTYLTR